MKAEVLITGASGYLGRHLLGAMHAQGIAAAALVRKPQDWPAEWQAEMGTVGLIAGTPMQPEQWQGAAQQAGVRTIIHAAGIVRHTRLDAEEMLQVNVEGTLQVLRAAKVIGARVVFVSSSGTVACYRHEDLRADEHAPFCEELAGRWPYYASKIRAEREGVRLAGKLDVQLSIVRLPVLLGPLDHKLRSTGHVTRVLDNRLPFVPSGGMHFTDVRDAAAAMARLTQLQSPRSIYHFPGTASSLASFFDMVSEVSGVYVTKRRVPAAVLNGVAQLTGRARSGLGVAQPYWLPDPVVLEMAACFWGMSSLWTPAELAYAPRAPRQTLSDTVTWLRQQRGSLAPHKEMHAAQHLS